MDDGVVGFIVKLSKDIKFSFKDLWKPCKSLLIVLAALDQFSHEFQQEVSVYLEVKLVVYGHCCKIAENMIEFLQIQKNQLDNDLVYQIIISRAQQASNIDQILQLIRPNVSTQVSSDQTVYLVNIFNLVDSYVANQFE